MARLMRLHLATINNLGCKYIDEEYKTLNRTLSVEDITEKKNHNAMIIDITLALSYAEFGEVKHYSNYF